MLETPHAISEKSTRKVGSLCGVPYPWSDYPPIHRRTRPRSWATQEMKYDTKIVDRQVGRNAELFAQAIDELETAEHRFPYLRILISIIEQAHPEWNQAPQKDRQIAFLIGQMCQHAMDADEVADVVRIRDEERGYFYE